MCEYVYVDQDIKKQMNDLFPNHLPKSYFGAFMHLVSKHTKANKDKRVVTKQQLDGIDGGKHELIHSTFIDVRESFPIFMRDYSF